MAQLDAEAIYDRMDDLMKLLRKLNLANPCPEHGKNWLNVCTHCSSIHCEKCFGNNVCHCQNDE